MPCCFHVRLKGADSAQLKHWKRIRTIRLHSVVTNQKMKVSQTRRAREALVDVLEPGKGKALLHVLADGRASGHYKLSKRQLEEVMRLVLDMSAEMAAALRNLPVK